MVELQFEVAHFPVVMAIIGLMLWIIIGLLNLKVFLILTAGVVAVFLAQQLYAAYKGDHWGG